MVAHACIPSARRQKWEDLWGSFASQLSPLGMVQGSEGFCLKLQSGQLLRIEVDLWLPHTCTYRFTFIDIHVHTHNWMDTHTNTYSCCLKNLEAIVLDLCPVSSLCAIAIFLFLVPSQDSPDPSFLNLCSCLCSNSSITY